MKELRNYVDYDAVFTDLQKAKDWYMPNLEEFPECTEYAKEIKDAETLEELAEVLNKYTDTYNDGRLHTVKEF